MNGLLWINLIAFLLVTAYAVSLFVYVIKTRMAYIKLGKKAEHLRSVQKNTIRLQ